MNPKPWLVIDPYTGMAEDTFWEFSDAITHATKMADLMHFAGFEGRFKIRRRKFYAN